MGFAGGHNKVFRNIMLQHQPHGTDIIRGMTPVALGIQLAEINLVLQAKFDTGHGPGDFPGDKGFAPYR